MDVTFAGVNFIDFPYHFNTVDGSGAQLASIPIAKPDTIKIRFSEAVDATTVGDSLSIVGMLHGVVPEVTFQSFASNIATWSVDPDGWQADQYILSLDDSKVTDLQGNALDGEWVNPLRRGSTASAISEFPSGDDFAGVIFIS